MKKPFFDKYGNLIRRLPKQLYADCHHQGACDADCKAWREKLSFAVPRNLAISYLKEFGAWDDLETWDDDRLAETVLWIAAGDVSENGKWYGLQH